MARDIMRWDPITEAENLHSAMDRLFDRMITRTNPAPRTWSQAEWTPLLDVEETDSQVVVRAELPGMKKDDIKVSGTKDSLCISGERCFDGEEKKKNYSRVERAYGKFQRCLSLPSDVEWDKTKAVYRDGVLELTLPKAATAQVRQIPIQT
ncbi:Hsp20/alpha crystallin family protein [candidate division WOR-3 bacterium]|nr:Hsp20/alpha crystallin family protein [candidate division WOR-3 bacterium]